MRWADLGENDETVRRIMELRKKRETRLMDGDRILIDEASPPPRVSSPVRPPRPGTAQSTNDYLPAKASQFLPPEPSIAVRPPSNGITNNDYRLAAPSNGGATAHPPTDHVARALPAPDPKLGPLNSIRPVTAKSTTSVEPPLLLDYSYARAVDALQVVDEREVASPDLKVAKLRGNQLALNSGATAKHAHRRVNSQSSVASSQLRKKNGMGRWNARKDSSDDPDARGSRRKSMSDARKTRYMEDELGAVRRDSVDDAVLNYLHSSRLSQRVPTPTGRLVSFSEVGAPNGAAVLVCVGMGLTRFVTAFYDELATTLRLRLITIERPGVGNSEPYPPGDKSGPLSWPDDVLAVCEHLGITKFSMLAHSAGAVYALATALILPHFVRGAIHLLGPWIPPSQLEAPSHSTDQSAAPAGALPRSQRLLRVLPTPFLRAANSSLMTAASSSLKPAKRLQPSGSSGYQVERPSTESTARSRNKRPPTSNGRPEAPRRESMMLMDRFMPNTNPMENWPLSTHHETVDLSQRRSSLFLSATITPTDPNFTFASTGLNAAEHAERERQVEFSSRLTQRTWEYAIRDSNPATDLLVCLERNRQIGFRYTDVSRRVIITHGSEDKRVPVNNIKWLADQMNRAALRRAPTTRDTYMSEIGTGGGCEVRILENEGHGLMALPTVMSDLLAEIAGYWTAEERGRTVQLPW